MNGEATRFKPGNKASEKWTEKEALDAFNGLYLYTKSNNKVLSLQQAYIEYGIPPSTYYYLTEKFPVLEKIKKGMHDVIIARINSGALTGDYVPTPAIWRMKQLGESDKQEIDHTNAGGKFESKTEVTFHNYKKDK